MFAAGRYPLEQEASHTNSDGRILVMGWSAIRSRVKTYDFRQGATYSSISASVENIDTAFCREWL